MPPQGEAGKSNVSLVASTYKQKIAIRDERFDIEKLADYTLCLQISDHDFNVCAIDKRENRCLLVEQYEIDQIYSAAQIIEQLELIYDDHHVLQAGYWGNIIVAFKNKKFSFIPASLFDENDIPNYLNLNCELDLSIESVGFTKHPNLDLVNTFAYSTGLSDWLEAKYPRKTINFHHQTSSLITGVLHSASKNGEKEMYIYCDEQNLNIVITKDNDLVYSNLFEYKSAEDLTYFAMFVIHELGLNPEKVPVTLWGTIDQTSIHFTRLFKFIRFLSLGKRPESLKFSYHFDEAFEHQFFDIYNLHLCY